jgi:ribosomal protein L40E
MTVAITLLLIMAILFSLSYPWLRPRASTSSPRVNNSQATSIKTLEDDIEQDIKRLRQTGKPARGEEDIEQDIKQLRQTGKPARGVCRKCGAEYPKEGRFCPQCGTKL